MNHVETGHRAIWGTTRQGMSCQPGAHRDDIYRVIDQERLYQDRRWGTIQEHPHEMKAWLAILHSQLLDAATAWSGTAGQERTTSAFDAVRKLAAVAVASMEQHGVVPRFPQRTFNRSAPPISFPRLWRAWSPDTMMLFLYADDENDALRHLQRMNLPGFTLCSAERLIKEGLSPVEAWRLFEVAHDSQWVHNPLFMGSEPLFFGDRDRLLKDIWAEGRLFWRLWRGCTPDDQLAVFVEAASLNEAQQKIYQAAVEQDPQLAHLDRSAIEIRSCAELIWDGYSSDYAFCLFERSASNGQRRWMCPPTFYQLSQALGLQCLYQEALLTAPVSHEGRP